MLASILPLNKTIFVTYKTSTNNSDSDGNSNSNSDEFNEDDDMKKIYIQDELDTLVNHKIITM